jgi:hypothetical protein
MKKSALVCIAKNEDQYIEEWLDYNHKLGFDDIFMYVNDWECNIERPFLHKIIINGENRQVISYNHFIHHFKNQYEWGAFFDCDEFLVLHKHSNVNEFLTEYDDLPGLAINWLFFGADGKVFRGEDKHTVLKQFIKREELPNQHIKTILKLNSGGIMVNPHNPNIFISDTNRKSFAGPFNENGPIDIVQLNHYYFRTYEDWVIKCDRGRADGGENREYDEWKQQQFNYCDVEDLSAINFMYEN